MITLKKWPSLAFLSCLGAAAFVACGEAACEKTLCIERPGNTIEDPDAGERVGASDADSSSAGGNQNGNQNGDGGSGGNAGDAGNVPIAGTGGDSGIDAGTDAGPDGGEDEPVPPPVCGANPVAGCIASTQDAVFVDVGMVVSGDGSQASPVKTIAEGIELARTEDAARIVVCNGVYEEFVALTVDDSGRFLSGGYNCDDWLFNPDGETLVRPTEQGFALEISDTTQRVTVSNLTFEAQPGAIPGESSVAAFVVDASDVRLKQVRLISHDGQSADGGVTRAFVAGNEWPSDNALDGDPGKGYISSDATLVDKGGVATTAQCTESGESTTGGRGGDHPTFALLGAVVGAHGLPMNKGGSGGVSSAPQSIASGCDTTGASPGYRCTCTPIAGRHGAAGDAGDTGAGASSVGELSSQGWMPQAGSAGGVGHPGGGGGGGDGAWQNASPNGYYAGWVGGGGGGAGGCGGAPGQPGLGGGASIALLILDSTVLLEGSELLVGNAGNAGSGSNGQAGQLSGSGGAATSVTNGSDINSFPCAGGNGGQGGAGGPGGGGAGGISVGVVWAGAFEPTVDADTVTTLGDAGAGGIGGKDGENYGIDGTAAAILEVPAG